MSQEPTINDVLQAISAFSTDMDQRFVKIDQRFERIDQRFEQIDQRLDRLDARVGHIEETMATKDDLAQMESRFMTEVDRFVVLHQTLDVELVSLRSRCDRMENFMAQVAKRLDLQYEAG